MDIEDSKEQFMSLVEDTFREYEQKLNAVYRERDLVLAMVAHIAKDAGYTVGLRLHEDDSKQQWEDEWRNVLFIELPTGQCSWHMHASELEYFKHLGYYPKSWDKHSTEEKYERVKKFVRNQEHS